MNKFSIFLLILFVLLLPPSYLHADDLEIFGGTTVSVEPNVLIIFDNSDSMALCVNGVPDNDDCPDPTDSRIFKAKNVVKELINNTDGVRFGLMVFNANSDGGNLLQPCGSSKTDLITSIDALDVTWGYPFILTPLAETLAEAGLYFADKTGWFNGGVKYTSPIQYSCQKNYIILMTDGAPTDDLTDVVNMTYINNDLIGNPDGDNCDPNGCLDDGTHSPVNLYAANFIEDGSDYLDDVAYYLSHNDCNADHPDDQFIQTFPIGFTVSNQLLLDTATNGNAKGDYYIASNATDLASAFDDILETLQSESNATYASPAIPRNPDNQVQAGNKVYLPFFKPKANGRWIGNLKAYTFEDGVLKDAVPLVATYPTDQNATDYVAGKEGYIKNTAQSLWPWTTTNEKDGLNVDFGGAGKLLAERPLAAQNERTVHTYVGLNADLKNSPTNKFTVDSSNNPQLTKELLNVSTAADRATVIRETLRGVSITLTGTTTTDYWPLGDIIHSEPRVESFESGGTTKSYLFVGANDGMLHVFNTADGKEEWAFVPPGQLPKLQKRTSLYAGTEHFYFVDGSPVIETVTDPSTSTTKKLLIFGEGRGGERYYTLDVTTPDEPLWEYQVTDLKLKSACLAGGGSTCDAAVLGQSWAKPQLKKVRYLENGSPAFSDVFLLAGGYDARYETETYPLVADLAGNKGRGVYTIDALDGALVGLNINGSNWTEMQHSILDVTAFDATDSDYINRVYAGDLGGKIFAAKYKYDATSDGWEKLVLMDLPATVSYVDPNDSSSTITATLGQKFMTKPEATIEYSGECIYLGTGDREHLTNTDNVDAFYTICNKWVKTKDQNDDYVLDGNGDFVYAPVSFSSLTDVTANLAQDGDASQRTTINSALQNSSGWFIRMEHSGEKITSSPIVIDGKVFFNTFTPGTDGTASTDPCTASFDLGVSRLYAVDYRTGEAVMNLDDSDDALTKSDRAIIIGTSVAPDPVLTTIGSKTTLVAGSGGKLLMLDVDTGAVLRRYYWRQVK